MSKPKILVFTSTYPRWAEDVEPSFVHHLNVQLSKDFSVYCLCPHFAGARRSERLDGVEVHRYRYQISMLETLVSDGGIISNLKAKPLKWLLLPFFLIGQFFALILEVKRIQPKAIHVHWIFSQGFVYSLLSVFMKNLPPMLITSHGGDLFALQGKIFLALKKWVLNKAAEITVVSMAMKDMLVAMGIKAEKIHVVSMGVDFKHTFVNSKLVKREANKIVFVGRLVEKKGVVFLLQAMEKIQKINSQVQLHIIGNGPEKGSLVSQTEHLKLTNQVFFHDAMAQKDLVIYYQSSSLFVAPFITAASGDQEGLGLVTLEAIACGTPVLVGDVPAVKDLFDKSDSCIIDAKDTESLVIKIQERLVDSNQFFQKAEFLRVKMENRYSWPAIGEKYSSILKRLVA